MHSDIVLRAENLSKRYALGNQVLFGRGFRHAFEDLVQGPAAWWRKRDRKGGSSPNDNEHYALRDVTFDVARGDVVGIIGSNGAGKSTLLKIVSRITEPTSGRVGIKGRMASLLEVGTGFHPELTGRENIYLNGAILGMRRTEIAKRFDEIVAFAEIDKFIDTPVKRYSSGMYVRLAFAVAAHLEPELLAVDEVLAVGDVAFQKKCLGKMGQVAQSDGRTVLFVSHNIQAVQRLCKTAILLEQGRIHRIGAPADVIGSYLDLQSRNRTEGPIRGRHASVCIRTDGARTEPVVSMGAPARFVVTLNVDRPVRNASVGIGIESTSGGRVLTFDSTLQHPCAWSVRRCVELVIDWPECILSPGKYLFVAALYDNGVPVEAWEYAGQLTVLETDYFGTGHFPEPSHQGKVVTKACWLIRELDSIDRAESKTRAGA